jgi:hypothetical protein
MTRACLECGRQWVDAGPSEPVWIVSPADVATASNADLGVHLGRKHVEEIE